MAVNQNLKNALADAGISLEEFASILAVDPKSVSRWVAGTSTPYPRHRAAISRALALDEAELWPDQVRLPVEPGSESSAPLPAGAGAHVRVWADGEDASTPILVEFIQTGSGSIDLLDTDLWFQLAGPVADALVARAAAGDEVRVACSAPRPDLAPLVRQSGVQVRCVDTRDVAVIRAGTAMLVASLLGGFAEQPPALIHAAADGSDGLYDRLSALFDMVWDDPLETITTVDQLEDYRTNAYDELEDDPEPGSDASIASQQYDVPDAPDEGGPPARRWPGSRRDESPT